MKEVLRFLLGGSFRLMNEVVESASDEEWVSRARPTANLIGFTPWHAARIIDWGVNHVLRERDELADSQEWSAMQVPGGVFGAGVTIEIADQTARSVPRKILAGYLSALGKDTLGWFDGVSVDELNEKTELRRRVAARPEYAAQPVWAEIEDLDGAPKWQFLARPCISHIRVHYGQVMSELASMRSLNSTRA